MINYMVSLLSFAISSGFFSLNLFFLS
uniref:Uncharacterized protein n=1 Tax=Rhizophora mucronata TaxID=61149 RepID=A0A2P2QR19_RHIMU